MASTAPLVPLALLAQRDAQVARCGLIETSAERADPRSDRTFS
jgi:hypothetical protein